MKRTACGPSDDYPGDEDPVQLKECTRDARANLASFFFREKIDVQVLVSVFFVTSSDTDPGTSTFPRKSIHNHLPHN